MCEEREREPVSVQGSFPQETHRTAEWYWKKEAAGGDGDDSKRRCKTVAANSEVGRKGGQTKDRFWEERIVL